MFYSIGLHVMRVLPRSHVRIVGQQHSRLVLRTVLSPFVRSTNFAMISTVTPSSRQQQQQPVLFMWGTDTKGSLLVPKNRIDEKIIDFPQPVQLSQYADTTISQDITTPVADDRSIVQEVICGPTDTAFLLKDGRCYVCGENKEGQLGLGHKNPVSIPTEIRLPSSSSSSTITQVSIGVTAGAYVDNFGILYTSGFGGSAFSGMGQLGHGNNSSYLEPKRVESLIEDGCMVQQVCMHESHMTVLTTEGELLSTGAGSYGRLGNFDTIDQLYLEPVELLTNNVIQLVGGKSFTLALTKEGIIYGFGRNHKGQLGTGLGLSVDMYAMQAVPEPIETDELVGRKVTKVAAGRSHAACITESGELFYWGMSLHLEPVRVDSLLHTKIVNVDCGDDYTLAVGEDGSIYSFGIGSTGVLGQGSIRRSNQAVRIEALQDYNVVQVSAGWKHAACLAEPKKRK